MTAVAAASEPTPRTCRTCQEPFVVGSRNECASCRSRRYEAARAPRTRGSGERKRQPFMRESVVDIGQAVSELQIAADEMASVPEGLQRHQRAAALMEPLSRLHLVKRFVDGVLRRHGVKLREVEE